LGIEFVFFGAASGVEVAVSCHEFSLWLVLSRASIAQLGTGLGMEV